MKKVNKIKIKTIHFKNIFIKNKVVYTLSTDISVSSRAGDLQILWPKVWIVVYLLLLLIEMACSDKIWYKESCIYPEKNNIVVGWAWHN